MARCSYPAVGVVALLTVGVIPSRAQTNAQATESRVFVLSSYTGVNSEANRFLCRNSGDVSAPLVAVPFDRIGGQIGVLAAQTLEPGELRQIAAEALPSGTATLRVDTTPAVNCQTALVAAGARISGLIPGLLRPSTNAIYTVPPGDGIRNRTLVLVNPGRSYVSPVLTASDSSGAPLGLWSLPALAPMETTEFKPTEYVSDALVAELGTLSISAESPLFMYTVSVEEQHVRVTVPGVQSTPLFLPSPVHTSDSLPRRHHTSEAQTSTDSRTLPLAANQPAATGTCPLALPTPSDVGAADGITCLTYDEAGAPDITDTRIPLILIHGIHGRSGDGGFVDTNTTLDGWEPLIAGLSTTYGLTSKYAIYRFSYDSDKYRVWELGKSLRNWLDYYIASGKIPDTKFVIIAHSMGGLVARAYMQQHKHNSGIYSGQDGGQRIVNLITLATPHHGSMAANAQSRDILSDNADRRDFVYLFIPGWTTTLNGASFWLWKRLSWDLRVTYSQPNRSDLLWDNSDHIVNDANADINAYLKDLDTASPYFSKIIAYYGYLDPNSSPYVALRRAVFDNAGGPVALTGKALSSDGHDNLLAASFGMAYGLYDKATNTAPYFFNDGVVPVQSGRFDSASLGAREQCINNDHYHMQDGSGPACTNGKLFDSLNTRLQKLATPVYIGYLESADCANGIDGWAWDANHPEVTQMVDILVDGSLQATVAAARFRQKLKDDYGGSGYHGFHYDIPASLKDGKQHTITARIANTSTFLTPLGTPSGLPLTCSAGGREIGYVDAAGDSTGAATVAQGGTLYVRGWAADTVSGAPVTSVTVYVDGSSKGTATLGGSRPDVATALGRSDYTNSGWSFQMAAASLAAGSHTVSATAVGPSGSAQLLGSKTITIQGGGGKEIGYVDVAGDSTGSSTVAQGGNLYVRGWAADTVSGAPVQSVTVYVDGASKGTATLGGSRPDVATALGRSDYTNSGWNFQMAASTLSAGSHTVTATAVGPSGSAQLVGSKTITVQTGGGSVIGFVDAAGDGAGAATVAQGGTLYVRGWAADTAGGAPVQTVTVYVDGASKGTATLGGSRPDVATAFSRSDFTNSGWNFQMSTASLSVGSHAVTATATGASGTGQLTNSKTINITAPAASYDGYLDVASCTLIKGWVWDSTQPNTSLQVDIYDGSTKIYSAVAANVFRQDLLNAGKGNGYHGFAFAPSGSLLNGGSHTLTAMITGTSYTLKNTQTLSGCLAPDFNFTTTTSSRSVQAGQQVGFDLSLTPVNNFTYPVTVFVSGLPSSTSVVNSSLQFSIGPTSGASFTLTLQTTGSTPVGNYTLTLQAQGGGINKYLYPTLTVTAPPPAPLSVSCYYSPNPITLGNGSTLFASATGGTGGYLYSLNGGSYQSSSSTTVLPNSGGSVSGSVTVKDSNNTTASNTCSLTVNGVAPSNISYYWDTQPIHGVPFSGYVYGNAFTPSAEVWFYGPGCTSGCKQPAGVTWQSLTSLRVVSIQLGQGSYQVEVRTAYGSARSGSFTVN